MKPTKVKSTNLEESSQNIISLEESKQYLGGFELTDQRILEIRNNLIGIINQVIHSYLEGFQ